MKTMLAGAAALALLAGVAGSNAAQAMPLTNLSTQAASPEAIQTTPVQYRRYRSAPRYRYWRRRPYAGFWGPRPYGYQYWRGYRPYAYPYAGYGYGYRPGAFFRFGPFAFGF